MPFTLPVGLLAAAATPATPSPAVSLAARAHAKGKRFGSFYNTADTGDADYLRLTAAECATTGVYTSESSASELVSMPSATGPTAITFDYTGLDAEVAAAIANGTLFDIPFLAAQNPGPVPSWYTAQITDATSAGQVLDTRADAFTTRYAAKVRTYLAVTNPRSATGPAVNPFATFLGEDFAAGYIAKTLIRLRTGDAVAALAISNLGCEMNDATSQATWTQVLALLTGLVAAGTPLTSFAFPARLIASQFVNWDAAAMTERLDAIAALGLTAEISEMDWTDDIAGTRDVRLEAAASGGAAFLATVLAHPAITTVTVRGLSMRYSALNVVGAPQPGARAGDFATQMTSPYSWAWRTTPIYDAVGAAFDALTGTTPVGPDLRTLQGHAFDAGRTFGSVISADALLDSDTAAATAAQIAGGTAASQSAFDEAAIQPVEGDFVVGAADVEVAFAQAHNIKYAVGPIVEGDNATPAPAWYGTAITSPATATTVLDALVDEEVGRYTAKAGRITLVRDPLGPGGDAEGFLTNSFYTQLGTEATRGYLAQLAARARLRDATAPLAIEQGGLETSASADVTTRTQVLAMLKNLVGGRIRMGSTVNKAESDTQPDYESTWNEIDTIAVCENATETHLMPSAAAIVLTSADITFDFTLLTWTLTNAQSRGKVVKLYLLEGANGNGTSGASPSWYNSRITDSTSALNVMYAVIDGICGYCATTFPGLVVVVNACNEAITGSGRNTNPFQHFIGDTWIRLAMARVRTHLPDATLQLNCDHTEDSANTGIWTNLDAFWADCAANGLTTNLSQGNEMHVVACVGSTIVSPSGDLVAIFGTGSTWVTRSTNLWTTYRVRTSVSELDITDYSHDGTAPNTAAIPLRDQDVADYTMLIVNAALSLPAGALDEVIVWQIPDKNTWLKAFLAARLDGQPGRPDMLGTVGTNNYAKKITSDGGNLYDRFRAVLPLGGGGGTSSIGILAIRSELDATNFATDWNGPDMVAFLDAVVALGVKVMITGARVIDNLAATDPATRDTAIAAVWSTYLTVTMAHAGVLGLEVDELSDRDLPANAVLPARTDALTQRSQPFTWAMQPKAAVFDAIASVFDTMSGITTGPPTEGTTGGTGTGATPPEAGDFGTVTGLLTSPPGAAAAGARPLSPAMLAAIGALAGEMCYLMSFAFDSGVVYLTTASADLTVNGETWLAIGGAITFGGITEAGDLSASQVDITVSGVNTSVIAVLLGSPYVYRTAQIYLVGFDPVTRAVLGSPVLLFQGLMNGGFQIKETRKAAEGHAGTVEVIARVAERVALLDQREGIQTNVPSHNLLYPGDLFFSFVTQLANAPVSWELGVQPTPDAQP